MITYIASRPLYDCLEQLMDAEPLQSFFGQCIYEVVTTSDQIAEATGVLNRTARPAGRNDIRHAVADYVTVRLLNMSVGLLVRCQLSDILTNEPPKSPFTSTVKALISDCDYITDFAGELCKDAALANRQDIVSAVGDYVLLGHIKTVIALRH